MSIHEITIQKGSHWENFGPAGSKMNIERTHPRYIHPTKGYRDVSRPRKTNRRRRPVMASVFPSSTEHNRLQRILGW